MRTVTDKPPTRRQDNLLPPVRHIASRESNYKRALCGTLRTRPLDPSLTGRTDQQWCVVCLELTRGKR